MSPRQYPRNCPTCTSPFLARAKWAEFSLQAFLKQNLFATRTRSTATVAHAEKAVARAAQWGVDVGTDNLAAARQADLILIGVKPFQVPDLVAEIKPALTTGKTIVSFAASVKTRAIEDAAGIEIPVIRAMPNTPSALGAGVAGLCRGRFVKLPHRWTWRSASSEKLLAALSSSMRSTWTPLSPALSRLRPATISTSSSRLLVKPASRSACPGDDGDGNNCCRADGLRRAGKMVLRKPGLYHPALLKDEVTTFPASAAPLRRHPSNWKKAACCMLNVDQVLSDARHRKSEAVSCRISAAIWKHWKRVPHP